MSGSTQRIIVFAALTAGLLTWTYARAAGETAALQAFIDAQAGTISTLTTRVTAAEATVAAQVATIALHEKRIAALEAWVKAYVPVASTSGPANALAPTSRGVWGSWPWVASTVALGTVTPTGRPPLGTAPTRTAILGTPPVPQGPHP